MYNVLGQSPSQNVPMHVHCPKSITRTTTGFLRLLRGLLYHLIIDHLAMGHQSMLRRCNRLRCPLARMVRPAML